MIDFEEIIVLRDEKNKQKARYAKHRKDAQKKARHRVCTIEEALESLQNIKRNGGYWRGNTSLDESIKQLELEL